MMDAWKQPCIHHIMGELYMRYGHSGADLRMSPAVTRLTVYRLPKYDLDPFDRDVLTIALWE